MAATDAILKEARERWNRCDEAEDAQRKRILLAKEFRAGKQWPDAIRIQREGGQGIQGQASQPPRPCLTIDRLSQPVRQISNVIKTANFAIDVQPNGFGADTETAEILKGYIRFVQNQARADSPIEWAADQAVEGGIGWFRLRSDFVYADIAGVPPEAIFDQQLQLERITNNLTVYCDPWSVSPTRRDARFMFVTEDLSRDEFKSRFGKSDVEMKSLDDFSATGDCPKGWVGKDNIRIAEYWRVQFQDEPYVELLTGEVVPASKDIPAEVIRRTRTVRTPRVEGYKISAVDVLEQWDWPGLRIPIFPILGEELNVDGKVYLRGVIEEGMDAQRMVNYTYSGAVELFALAPKSPWVAAEDQIAEYKTIWQTANVYNYAYLPYKPVTQGGTFLPPPQRNQAEPPIQAAALLLQVSEEAIKATTGIWDPSLGQQTDRAKSGRAIQALQGQSDLGSSNYPDNVRRALIDVGNEMVYIAPKITRKGQFLQILGVDDQPEQVIIGQPYIDQQGQAQPIDETEAARYEQGLVKLYDLAKGRYAVTVAVSKSFTTKREEGAAAIGELIPHLPPPMAAAVTPEFIENLSFPGAHKIAETARRALPPELQEPTDGEEPIPAAAQQQILQLEQMVQQLQPLADKNQVDLQKAHMAAQASLAEKQLQEQAENQRTLAKIAADQAIATRELEVKLEIEMAKLGSAQSLARGEIEQQQLHQHNDLAMREQERASASAQADLDRRAAQAQPSGNEA
jgi:hypothetical protein